VNLIALYGRKPDWEKAEAHYRAVLALGNVPAEAHFNFGICLAAQGKTDEAADAFRKTLDVNPQHAGAWSSIGQLAELGGRVADAEAAYRKAAERAPGDPLMRFNVARMLIARQQYQAAIAELDPIKTVDHPDRARFLFGLATATVLSGNVVDGRRYAIEARDLARARGQTELAAAIDRDLATLAATP
jgi:tetratricopeptide (TPR) repeat protein